MDAATLAALCLLHARSPDAYPLAQGVTCAGEPATAMATDPAALSPLVDTPEAREAIGRVAYAEAGNQGDSGLAGVVYTILNRLADGRWGGSVEAVVNAPHQFEPVMRAGGRWQALRPVSEAQQAHIDTIINLALDGRLPDLTGGARYFQNPTIVAARAKAGSVSAALVNFGGATPTTVIGAHACYAAPVGGGSSTRPATSRSTLASRRAGGEIFVGENRAAPDGQYDQGGSQSDTPNHGAAPPPKPIQQVAASTTDGIFIRADGTSSDDDRR
jgi:N-acetylmuramoyl-L-alanine amidase